MKRRVIFSDNGALNDMSSLLNDFSGDSTSVSYTTSEDTIFIGSTLPFNSFFISIGTVVNAESATAQVSVWDGSDWASTVEVDDRTSVGGKPLARSGRLSFVPDKNESWGKDDTILSSGSESVTGLGDVTIYDKYWAALTYNATLTGNVHLKWLGSIFSDDTALGAEFPELVTDTIKTAFESGKTNWDQQHKIAADIIIKDLERKNIIVTSDQILDYEDLTLASVQKVAETIFRSLGDSYQGDVDAARKEYYTRLNSAGVKVDQNRNARMEPNEVTPTLMRITR